MNPGVTVGLLITTYFRWGANANSGFRARIKRPDFLSRCDWSNTGNCRQEDAVGSSAADDTVGRHEDKALIRPGLEGQGFELQGVSCAANDKLV